MAERQSVRIKIFGTEYVLKGDTNPEYMQELARMVDMKMRELGEPGAVQVNRVAILTAFQFADELMKVKRTLDTERQSNAQAARQLAQLDLKIQEALHDESPPAAPSPSLTMEEAPREAEAPVMPVEPPGNKGEEDEEDDLNWT